MRRPRTRTRTAGLALTVAAATLAVPLAACTSAGPADEPTAAVTDLKDHAPTTIDVWSFTKLPNEVVAFKASFDALKADYPWLTVNFVPNKDDASFAKAVAAGDPPDVLISWGPDNLGKFCYDGTVADLTGYLKAAAVDVEKTFLPATLAYTRFDGKQCALPLLTDVEVLYYNKKMFAEAGIAAPPKTLGELTEDAKKLTVRAADGTVSRFGFVPRSDYNLNISLYGGVYSGSRVYDDAGHSTLGTDPKWPALLQWDRDLISWYGDAQVQKFVGTYNAHTDDAENAFMTGKLAMEFHGEWKIGELAESAPSLDYGVAPFPVLDAVADTYGGSLAAGTVVYLPAGAKHQQEAFLAARQLATDTSFLLRLADLVSNVPTTAESLARWDKKSDPHWAPVIDTFARTRPNGSALSAAGAEPDDAWKAYLQDVETGKVTDVQAGLGDLAARIDTINAAARQ